MKIDILVPNFSDSDEVVGKFCAKNLKTPYSVELIFLPFMLFKYRLDLKRFYGGGKTEEGLFLVDLLQGIPVNIKRNTIFEISEGLKEEFDFIFDLSARNNDKKKNKVLIRRKEVEEEKVMPVLLKADMAIEKGKTLLRYDIMRLAGNLRYRKMAIIPQPKRKVLYYPYWLIYYRNKRGEMRFDVLDGLSGAKESGQIVDSIKMGLVKKHDN